jgi:hypothetical protein
MSDSEPDNCPANYNTAIIIILIIIIIIISSIIIYKYNECNKMKEKCSNNIEEQPNYMSGEQPNY